MKKSFCTENGPKAIGPYSTVMIHNDTGYLSGMLPIVPATGILAEGDAAAQTAQVMENIKGVLGELNRTMSDILKVSIFLRNIDSFSAVNEVYARYFSSNYPARICVEVSNIPRGAQVEIDAIFAMD